MEIENLLFFSNGVSGDNGSLTLERLAQKAGMIWQEGSGVWSVLSIGHLAQEAIETRVHQVMRNLGASACQLSLAQDVGSWEKSGRAAVFGKELMKVKCRDGKVLALSATAEEAISKIIGGLFGGAGFEGWAYQIGAKFRDELRARGGLIRAKEFRMMDAYSFAKEEAQIKKRHEAAVEAFERLVNSFGLKSQIRKADCGEMGGLESVEIGIDSRLGDAEGYLELAHLFVLGDKYTKIFNARAKGGGFLQMGCQGIGISRLLMALLEARRDEHGFWGDESFCCADYYIMTIGDGEKERLAALKAKALLEATGKRVIMDLRNISAGKKFMDSELVCVQERIVFSPVGSLNREVEITTRKNMSTRKMSYTEAGLSSFF